jgi:pimeloyl-ACP methyl ester carboxylesterase
LLRPAEVTVPRADLSFSSTGGSLRLHAEVRGPKDAPLTVLCLHGLTRNVADFGFIAEHLSARYRVLAADQRGRGKSQWDPQTANYRPTTYVADMFGLLDQLAIERVAVIGTSMGGIMAMLMGAMQPRRLQGIVLNDIGPEVPVAGLARLRRSLNERTPANTWAEASLQTRRLNEMDFPDYGEADWDAFARRTYVQGPAGRPVPAFDPAILNGLRATDPSTVPPDMWASWRQLGAIPILAIRGALSDILSAETLVSMSERHPNLTALTLPNRGHAPMLDEPAAVAAIDEFLRRSTAQ